MRAATLFSGIGAPEVAMPGWEWLWHAEIEAFPSAVMAARHPGSINLGDVTAPDFVERALDAGRPDIVVFGSPCQSFSVAGKRLGLADPRGNLALTALELVRRIRPRWICFENVPGLLSSDKGRDFDAFLSTVAECGYLGCWRVLDAQFTGVPQRRRRIFFVGHLGDWRPAAAVLSLIEGMSGHPAQGDEAGERVAVGATIGSYAGGLGELSNVSPSLQASGGEDQRGVRNPLIARSLNAHPSRSDGESETFVTHSLRADGFDASEDGTGRGTPLVIGLVTNDSAPVSTDGTICPTLRVGTGLEINSAPAIAFTCKDSGLDAGDIAPTLRAMPHDGSHANAGGQVAIAMNLRGRDGGAMPECDDLASVRAASGGSSRSYVATVAINTDDTVNSANNLELADGYATEAGPGEILRDVLHEVGEEAFCEWCLGVLSSFPKTEVLQRRMLQQVADEGEVRRLVEFGAHDVSQPRTAGTMREVREAGCARRTPQEWRLARCLADKLGAYLSELPQQGAPPSSLLRDLWSTAREPGILRDALSALAETWRSADSHREAEDHVQGVRSTEPSESSLRQALHAGKTRTTQVRRLSVIECARLQGFPDLHTHIVTKRWRKISAEEARYLASHGLPVEQRREHCAGRWYTPVPADGPMYRAYGNSMAVPCIRWILERVGAVDAAMHGESAAA